MSKRRSSTGGKRAALYLRMSKDKQEESIPSQRRALLKLAETEGYQVTEEYEDRGISGDLTEKRLGFQRMMADCAKGLFGVILCWDQDRFGRFDPLTAGYWVQPMRDAGIVLHTIAQGVIDWESFEGRIVWTVTQEGKHAYLRDMARNCLRGVRDAVLSGKRVSRAPVGYRIDGETGRLRIVPEEAAFVRHVFREYADGKSLRELTISLSGHPIQPERSGGWDFSTIRGILKNHTYTGDTVWNKTNRGRYSRASAEGVVLAGKPGAAPATSVIVVPATHEPIVSKTDFALVAKRLESNRTQRSRNRDGYLFSSLIRCGHCGSAMSGRPDNPNPNRKDGKTYSYLIYTCQGYEKKGRGYCERRAINQDRLLEIVREELLKFIDKEGMQAGLRAELKKLSSSKRSGDRVAIAQKKLDDLDAKLKDSRRRFFDLPKDKGELVLEHLNELTKERSEAESELLRLKSKQITPEEYGRKISRAEATASQLRDWLTGTSQTDLRRAIHAMVSRITLQFEIRKAKKNKFSHLSKCHIEFRDASDFCDHV